MNKDLLYKNMRLFAALGCFGIAILYTIVFIELIKNPAIYNTNWFMILSHFTYILASVFLSFHFFGDKKP